MMSQAAVVKVTRSVLVLAIACSLLCFVRAVRVYDVGDARCETTVVACLLQGVWLPPERSAVLRQRRGRTSSSRARRSRQRPQLVSETD